MKTRAEHKRDYKSAPPAMGVVLVRNLRNGRFIVEASRNAMGRVNRFKFEITSSTNVNPQLQADWRTMGPDAFEIRVLDELKPKDVPGWDPAEDLEQLKSMWHTRMIEEGGTPY